MFSDESMIPFMITMTMLTVIFIFFMVVFLITFQKKQSRKNRQYLEALIAEKDKTMSSISVEIHDNINQVLNVIRMTLHMLDSVSESEREKMTDKMGQMLDQVINDSNNISHTLNTEYLKRKGLVTALREEVGWVNISRQIECEMSVVGITEKFESQHDLMIFRIAQEAINNSIKHSSASKIEIIIRYEQQGFTMLVRDNGRGFDASDGSYRQSVGMTSMLERARIVNGQLSIKSRPDDGTTVHLFVPATKG